MKLTSQIYYAGKDATDAIERFLRSRKVGYAISPATKITYAIQFDDSSTGVLGPVIDLLHKDMVCRTKRKVNLNNYANQFRWC